MFLANLKMKKAQIIPHFLVKYRSQKLRVGFSGGADSTALLLLLLKWGFAPDQLEAVHFDHGLRGEASTADGEWCDYTGILDFVTEGSRDRMIGNYAFRLGPESGGGVVVGFENHGGRTRLGSGLTPLGAVLKGCGNNGQDGTEGVRYRNVFGTYSHGPVLPLNPALCDLLLETALRQKYGEEVKLEPLPDGAETAARSALLKRLTGKDKE